MIGNVFRRMVEKSRKLRSKYLSKFVEPLAEWGFTANQFTVLSFMTALLAVWFLFEDHNLFLGFGITHLLLDGFDGVLARVTEPTKFGQYFDTISDNLVPILFLGRSYVFLENNLALIAASLYLVHMLIYLYFRLKGPVLYGRTALLVLFFFELYLPGIYVIMAIAVLGILLQLSHQLTSFNPSR